MQEPLRLPKQSRNDGKTSATDEDFVLIDVAGAKLKREQSAAGDSVGKPDVAEEAKLPLPEVPAAYAAEVAVEDVPASAAFSAPSQQTSGSRYTPLLVIATAGSLLFAGWSYNALESTRMELSTAMAAKALSDRALVDAQSRLSAAEKAIDDVKSALSAAPATPKP